ncbi:hypothetical protein OC845_006529 [Tilletia horrida]|nr:hypothetical protein OC845_006529 [Tilletia horrida]
MSSNLDCSYILKCADRNGIYRIRSEGDLWVIDLHRLSLAQAKTFCEASLWYTLWQRGALYIEVIHGAANHANEGRRGVLQEAIPAFIRRELRLPILFGPNGNTGRTGIWLPGDE